VTELNKARLTQGKGDSARKKRKKRKKKKEQKQPPTKEKKKKKKKKSRKWGPIVKQTGRSRSQRRN